VYRELHIVARSPLVVSQESGNARVVCKTDDGKEVVFWASVRGGAPRLLELGRQEPPFTVAGDIDEAPEWAMRQYGATYWVGEEAERGIVE